MAKQNTMNPWNSVKLFVLSLLLLTTACAKWREIPVRSQVRVYERASINISESPEVILEIANDPERLNGYLKERLRALGFSTESAKPAAYRVKVEYKTYWDVIHQTFVYFDMQFISTQDGQTKLHLRYVGGSNSYNNCEKALNLVFQTLSKNLQP